MLTQRPFRAASMRKDTLVPPVCSWEGDWLASVAEGAGGCARAVWGRWAWLPRGPAGLGPPSPSRSSLHLRDKGPPREPACQLGVRTPYRDNTDALHLRRWKPRLCLCRAPNVDAEKPSRGGLGKEGRGRLALPSARGSSSESQNSLRETLRLWLASLGTLPSSCPVACFLSPPPHLAREGSGGCSRALVPPPTAGA